MLLAADLQIVAGEDPQKVMQRVHTIHHLPWATRLHNVAGNAVGRRATAALHQHALNFCAHTDRYTGLLHEHGVNAPHRDRQAVSITGGSLTQTWAARQKTHMSMK